jgi:phosphatidylserine decarboxylase
MKKTLFILLQHLLPQHLLSRLVGRLASCEWRWLKSALIRRFIRAYDVDMSEALQRDPDAYASFNAFFTRELRPGARPLAGAATAVLCPADGALSAIGRIEADTLLQAKGRHYTVSDLLGGDAQRAAQFRNGRFATVYLSPRDYHRVHMPLAGTLQELIYVPGRLFSVNQTTAERIPGLFARNERAVCLFETAQGPMAVVLVGALIVAAIDTVWAGQIAPAGHGLLHTNYRTASPPIHLQKGAELGRFRLGSTAIVLFGPDMLEWEAELAGGSAVRLGEQLGSLC